jgi:Tubulin-tyrosine ligase family
LIGEVRYDYNGFELMGFDFMLDDDLKLYMIECNTNPCLETAQSILLQRLIPTVLDQTCKLAVDPFLRANEQQYANASEISLTEFKYEMVYEQRLEHFPPKGKSATNDKGKADPVNVATIDEEEELPPGET